jgi:4-hydroxybenzoate polyprenyltransferase
MQKMNKQKIKEYAKLMRIPALGTSLTAVIGAITIKGSMLEIPNFLILFTMGCISTITGFVLNDYIDYNIDKKSKENQDRPLVKGTVSKKSALYIVIIGIILNFILLLIFFNRLLPVAFRIISMILGTSYNIFSKKIVGADLFFAGSMFFFSLFGATAVSSNISTIHNISGLTWTVAFVSFLLVFIINAIEGHLKDVENDRKAGVKNLAVYLGVRAKEKMYFPLSFKIIALMSNIILISIFFIPFIFFNLSFYMWQLLLLIISSIEILYLTVKIITVKKYNPKKIGRYAGIRDFVTFTMLPLMLWRFIGTKWALFLIIFPAIWLVSFNYLIYKDLPEPGSLTIPMSKKDS